MNLLTNFESIRYHIPCETGWRKLLNAYINSDDDWPYQPERIISLLGILKSNGVIDAYCWPYQPERIISLLGILKSNGVIDAYWSLRCWKYQEYCNLLADVLQTLVDKVESDQFKHEANWVLTYMRRYHTGTISADRLAGHRRFFEHIKWTSGTLKSLAELISRIVNPEYAASSGWLVCKIPARMLEGNFFGVDYGEYLKTCESLMMKFINNVEEK